MSKQTPRIYEFGAFRLDEREGLLRHGRSVALPQKAVETLVALVEQSGRVVEKDELMQRLWPNTFVEENNLTHYVSMLRKTLTNGEEGGERFIETVPKRGYRFTADVHELQDADAETIYTERTRARLVIREEVEETDEEPQTPAAPPRPAPARVRGLSPKALALTALIALVAASVATYVFISRRARQNDSTTTQVVLPKIRSIAVLPFKPLNAESSDESLSLGMTDALITKLDHLENVIVKSTETMQKYYEDGRDPVAVGRELDADAVLDGRMQKEGGRVRLTAQLVSVRDGSPLWTEKFDGSFADIFAAEDAVAERVARALNQNLSEQEKSLLNRHSTENVEAYEAYLKGRSYWNKRTPQDMNEALKYFHEAVRIDPFYAQAYAGLTDSYLLGGHDGDEFSAKDFARKAISLDETSAEAHTSLAYYLSAVERDWAGAEIEFRRAIELNPSYATAHHWYAYHLASTGRIEEAVEEINRAREIDPGSLIINTDVGHILYLGRYYNPAIAQYRKVLEAEPGFAVAHLRLGEVYVQKEMFDEAIAEFQKADALGQAGKAYLPYAYALSGRRREAEAALGEMKEGVRKDDLRWEYFIALGYAALGESDQAFAWLQEAFKRRSGQLALLKVDPTLDSLRPDRRFRDLLRRMNLTEPTEKVASSGR